MQDVRSRSDGIRAEKKRKAGLLGSSDKSEGERGIAADIAIDAGLQVSPAEFRS